MSGFQNTGAMLDHRSRQENSVGHLFRDFLGWFLRSVMILGAISMVASRYIRWNQEISDLRLSKERLKSEIGEQAKMLKSRSIELERLKDGRYILPRARRLGMRPPTAEQFVRQMQVVDGSGKSRVIADNQRDLSYSLW